MVEADLVVTGFGPPCSYCYYINYVCASTHGLRLLEGAWAHPECVHYSLFYIGCGYDGLGVDVGLVVDVGLGADVGPDIGLGVDVGAAARDSAITAAPSLLSMPAAQIHSGV